MKKYLWIAAIVLVAAVLVYFLWGWVDKNDRSENSDCAMAIAKGNLFEEAISEFGATSPDEAALLWGKGLQKRNGALQYAVLSDELKKILKHNLDKERPSWVTGVSSPWIDKYIIIESKKVSKGEYAVTMEISFATSTGNAGSYLVKLAVINEGKYWVISNVSADDFILDYTFLRPQQ